MRPTLLGARRAPALSHAMRGVSLVELMIALTLGMIVLAALATFFASTSAARQELERTSRQVENGRFAIEMISDDLRLAGFYGELTIAQRPNDSQLPVAWPSPCSFTDTDWAKALWMPIQAYDNGLGSPGCLPGNLKPGTDILVIRRAASCEAGVGACPVTQPNHAYFQVSKCQTENILPDVNYRLGVIGAASFVKSLRNCTTRAGLREYIVRMYYIALDNGQGQNVPTLMRVEMTGTTYKITPLVEGIEELNIEYGIDWTYDGIPDGYTADPNNYAPGACGAECTPIRNWTNIVAARVYLLARNIDATPNYTDNKSYTLGRDVNNGQVVVTPGGAYKRHVYSALVRVVNLAQRRDAP